jgi:hypothetical protein
VSISGNAMPPEQGGDIHLGGRIRNVLPLVGVGIALIVNAAWITFLAYCILNLI